MKTLAPRLTRLMLLGMGLVFALPAQAQNEAVLQQLGQLYERLAKPGVVPAPDAVQKADSQLGGWALDPAKLSGEHRARLLTLQALVALGHGDAATAHSSAGPILESSKDVAAIEVAYYAACAAGDAALGEQALAALAATTDENAKSSVPTRRRCNQLSGGAAPDVLIRLDDVSEISPRKRGSKALLIDFWSMLPAPADDQVAALRRLYAEMRAAGGMEFIGVNADSESRTEKARAFAKSGGYEWKQRYETVSGKAPITHGAFKCGTPPWTVVIDHYGYIRATGAAGDPGVIYAARAAAAEARGDFERVRTRTRDGKQPEEPREPVATVTDKPKPTVGAGSGEAKSSPEAASKLRQAIVFRKTGKYKDARRLLQEIIRDYPGTHEASDAEAELTNLPP